MLAPRRAAVRLRSGAGAVAVRSWRMKGERPSGREGFCGALSVCGAVVESASSSTVSERSERAGVFHERFCKRGSPQATPRS